MSSRAGNTSVPTSSPTSANIPEDAVRAAALVLSLLAAQSSSPPAELPLIERLDNAEDIPDPSTPDVESHIHDWLAATHREEHLSPEAPSGDDGLPAIQKRDDLEDRARNSPGRHESPFPPATQERPPVAEASSSSRSSPTGQINSRSRQQRPIHISIPVLASERPLPSLPSPVHARRGTGSSSSGRIRRPHFERKVSDRLTHESLSSEPGRMPKVRSFPGVGARGISETLGPVHITHTPIASPPEVEPRRPGWYGDQEARAAFDAQQRRSIRASEDQGEERGEDREESGGRGLRSRRGSRERGRSGSRNNDREDGPSDGTQSSVFSGKVSGQTQAGTVGYRLRTTLKTAEDERDKAKKQATWTNYALNIAIGLQVLFGALTTGLGAALSGKSTSAPLVISVLGGVSTILASYLARARGSGEPERSALRVHDLEHFIRQVKDFCDDYGLETGTEYDDQLRRYRKELEDLLGNHGDNDMPVQKSQEHGAGILPLHNGSGQVPPSTLVSHSSPHNNIRLQLATNHHPPPTPLSTLAGGTNGVAHTSQPAQHSYFVAQSPPQTAVHEIHASNPTPHAVTTVHPTPLHTVVSNPALAHTSPQVATGWQGSGIASGPVNVLGTQFANSSLVQHPTSQVYTVHGEVVTPPIVVGVPPSTPGVFSTVGSAASPHGGVPVVYAGPTAAPQYVSSAQSYFDPANTVYNLASAVGTAIANAAQDGADVSVNASVDPNSVQADVGQQGGDSQAPPVVIDGGTNQQNNVQPGINVTLGVPPQT